MSILQELSQIFEGIDKPTCCKVGDTVWAKDPFNKAKTVTGKVKKVGRTTYTLTLKDGSEESYPHKDVSADYDTINPKTKRKIDEVSTACLTSYKKKAGEDASAKDKEADIAFKNGDLGAGKKLTKKADKRFSGIVKATKKQFDNDKSLEEQLLENAELHKLGKQLKGKDASTEGEAAPEEKPAPYGVEIGQVYVPADGSSGELTVVGLELDKDDAIVQDSDTGEERHIDLFKLAKVRYKLKDESSDEEQSDEFSGDESSTEEPVSDETEDSDTSAEEATPEFKIGDIVIPNKGNHKGEKHEILQINDDGLLVIKPKDLEGDAIKYRKGKIKAKPEDVALAESYKDAFKGFKLFDKNSSLMSQVAVNLNEEDAKAKWEAEIKKVHPDLVGKMKFKNRIEQGKDTTSAEIGDRSYGVFDNDTNKGKVFKLNESVKSTKEANRFINRLTAKLKPLGFDYVRDSWVDSNKNFVKMAIDMDEKDGWITWSAGKKAKVIFRGSVGFDKAQDVLDKIMAFANSAK